MTDKTFNVMFLCSGNTARSILAESILREDGQGLCNAYSAGSLPKGMVNPLTLAVLEERGYPVAGLRSKSWDEFNRPDAPEMDFVFTVCDDAAETCPAWPGHPITAHWGIADPAAVEGADFEKRAAFETAFDRMRNRISLFLALPLRTLDAMALARRVKGIGGAAGATARAGYASALDPNVAQAEPGKHWV